MAEIVNEGKVVLFAFRIICVSAFLFETLVHLWYKPSEGFGLSAAVEGYRCSTLI